MYYSVMIGNTRVSKIKASSPVDAIKKAIEAAEWRILHDEIDDNGAEMSLAIVVREYVL